MKNLLLAIICACLLSLLFTNAVYSQIKGDPQMQGKLQQQNVSKPSVKISNELLNLHNNFVPASPGGFPNKPGSSSGLGKFMQIKGDKVLVDFTTDNTVAAAAQLKKMGVIITGMYGRVISGFVPISILPQLDAVSFIRYARPSYKPMHQSFQEKISPGESPSPNSPIQPVISQGDTAQLSFIARKKNHVDGDGVKVGVLSDSYNNLGTADVGVMQGELPGKANPFGYKKNVQVLSDLDSGGTDGRKGHDGNNTRCSPRCSTCFSHCI